MSTSVNKGAQNLFFQYGDPITGAEFNAKESKIAPLGIYDGGLLSIIDNSTVELSAWTAILSDGTYTVTARATAVYDITVTSTNRNIVLRWTYSTRNDWYVDVLAVADGSIQANDVIVGRVVFTGGGVIQGFSYTTRTDGYNLLNFLRVQPTAPASMKVLIRGGVATYGTAKLVVPIQSSASFTAPVANPRIDIVYVDTNGAVQVQAGTEAVSPVAPSYAGKIVLAEVTLTVGMTTIAASNITDVRGFLSGVSSANFMDLTSNQTAQGVKKFLGGIVIENRTDDPSTPDTGRIWLRTDL